MAILLKADGSESEVTAMEGHFKLEALYALLDCGTIDMQMTAHPTHPQMILDDEGKLHGKPMNAKATELWAQTWGTKEEYLIARGDHIVGDVLLCTMTEFR